MCTKNFSTFFEFEVCRFTKKNMGSKRKISTESDEPSSKIPKSSKQSRGNIYEDFCLRFPNVAESFFDKLDNKSLANCRKVSRAWKTVLTAPKFILLRKIEKTLENKDQFRKLWKPIAKSLSAESLKHLNLATCLFYSETKISNDEVALISKDDPKSNSITPLHVAAGKGNFYDSGNTSLWTILVEKVNDVEPRDGYGNTPLHYAAMFGNLEICQKIIGNIKDAHLKNEDEKTPLHFAAENSHSEVCKLILERVSDKNPKDCEGITPLHAVAVTGNDELYDDIANQFFLLDLNVNPKDNYGWTPLHSAAKEGHFNICKWIIEVGDVDDANPEDNAGRTPLHEAANNCNAKICELITEWTNDKNPKDDEGNTPRDLWEEASQKLQQKLFGDIDAADWHESNGGWFGGFDDSHGGSNDSFGGSDDSKEEEDVNDTDDSFKASDDSEEQTTEDEEVNDTDDSLKGSDDSKKQIPEDKASVPQLPEFKKAIQAKSNIDRIYNAIREMFSTLKISDIKERCTPKAKKARIEPPTIIAEEVTDFEFINFTTTLFDVVFELNKEEQLTMEEVKMAIFEQSRITCIKKLIDLD